MVIRMRAGMLANIGTERTERTERRGGLARFGLRRQVRSGFPYPPLHIAEAAVARSVGLPTAVMGLIQTALGRPPP